MLEVFFPAAHTIILLGRFLTFAHKQCLLFKLREDTELQGTVSIPPAQSVHESTEFYTFHHGSGDRLWGTLTTETRWTETGRGCWTSHGRVIYFYLTPLTLSLSHHASFSMSLLLLLLNKYAILFGTNI